MRPNNFVFQSSLIDYYLFEIFIGRFSRKIQVGLTLNCADQAAVPKSYILNYCEVDDSDRACQGEGVLTFYYFL